MIYIKLKPVKNKKNLLFHIIVGSKPTGNTKRWEEKLWYYTPMPDSWGNKYLWLDIDKYLYWVCRGGISSRSFFFLGIPFFISFLKIK